MTSCWTSLGHGSPQPLANLAEISEILKAPNAFVWLDVVDPGADDLALIQEEFKLHPLAIEDAIKAHERPKIEAYGDSWFVVVHGATRDGATLTIHEIAIFAGSKFVVTVRALPAFPLDEIERRWQHQPNNAPRDGGTLLYTILDTVVDGYSPIAEAFEEHVEVLESALLGEGRRTDDVLLEILAMKKDLGRFRRAVVPMRDILTPIIRGDMRLFAENELPYYRDVYDHVARVVDQMDAARDLVNNARDTHISIASHRQNEVARQLTIVATIFLPLSFITGFFGQNFGWLINHITSTGAFLAFGIGTEILAVVALLGYFRFKRWF
ncbi:MAG: magnesium transporter CorA family protein [Vulcanimicrobiaceae bacterium]